MEKGIVPSEKASFLRKYRTLVLAFFLSLFGFNSLSAQQLVPKDSILIDSTSKSLPLDTLSLPESKSKLDAPIYYKADDSVVYDIEHKKVYLYGNAHIQYEKIDLKAAFITIDWITNSVYAEPLTDSTGKKIGYPVFKQGEEEITTKKMAYNFVTKKGRVNDLITKEDEGYIRGEVVKSFEKDGKRISYVLNGSYTTCDYAANPELEPHFYFKTKKLKLIQNDKVISGPAFLVVEGVPMPVVLPFGFFPANSRKTSGIIPPAIGGADTRGYVLRGGGYYYGGSKFFDLAVTTDLYSGGSYRIGGSTRYAKRYRFTGGLQFDVARNSYGLPETKDFYISRDFSFRWTHVQDNKARPGTSFSSEVNFPSINFQKNNSYDPARILNQSVNSSINYSKTFIGTPFFFSAAARHSENLQTGDMTLNLPELSLSMTRITPFKSKKAIGNHWYDKIYLSSNLNFKNTMATNEKTVVEDLKNPDKYAAGGNWNTPLSTSFKVLKWFTFTPSVSYNQYFYNKKTVYSDYTPDDSVVKTTTNGFYTAMEGSANGALNTTMYGMLKFNKGKLIAIRHVLKPTLTVSYRPDFSTPFWGYYQSYISDSIGSVKKYSPYSGNVVGVPGAGKNGVLALSLNNNFEMKVKTKDTANPTRKIRLLDNLDLSGYYNFLDTSFYKLSNISLSARTTLFQKLSVTAISTLNPYRLDSIGNRMREFSWTHNHTPATFTNAEISLGLNLNSKKKDEGAVQYANANPLYSWFYYTQYADFSVPWNLSLSSSINYNRFAEKKISQTINFGGELNLTKNWKVSGSSGYDFTSHNFSLTNINIYRDLHCWEASLQWSPFGYSKYYLFNLRIKAAALRDLKLEKRKDFRY